MLASAMIRDTPKIISTWATRFLSLCLASPFSLRLVSPRQVCYSRHDPKRSQILRHWHSCFVFVKQSNLQTLLLDKQGITPKVCATVCLSCHNAVRWCVIILTLIKPQTFVTRSCLPAEECALLRKSHVCACENVNNAQVNCNDAGAW